MPPTIALSEDILINVTPFETRVALVEQGSVQELHVERSIQRGHVGNIYLGRVVRVLPGMQSAFIDIGLERAAFIHIADLRENRGERSQGLTPTPIEKLLFEGQTIMVQVVKDPWAPRAPACRRRSAWPAACWYTCRTIRTSAFRRRSTRSPSASNCASGCRR